MSGNDCDGKECEGGCAADNAERLPTAVWSGEFRIGSLVLKCHVLADGRRIVEAESVAEFTRWLETPGEPTADVRAFAERFGRWQRGEDAPWP